MLGYLGYTTDSASFIGSLFAAIFSAFVVLFIEMALRPKLKLNIEDNAPINEKGFKFLRIVIENKSLCWPLINIMDRRPAYQVTAIIQFLTETNTPIFSEKKLMQGRWGNTPEPVRPISVNNNTINRPSVTFMYDLSSTKESLDISSGSKEPLDIVMRKPDEDGCRGWNNRVIGNPNVQKKDQYELKSGRYHAFVKVETSGKVYYGLYRIVCDVSIEDFRLEKLDKIPRYLK